MRFKRGTSFNEKVMPVPESGCWIWLGAVNNKGYAILGSGHYAHRFAWAQANNMQIPNGMVVRHKCDVACCVNPNHLELGSMRDNTQDAIKRGRFKFLETRKGESVNTSKLNSGDVAYIRKVLSDFPQITYADVARRFNVSLSNIRKIARNEYWKHLE